MNFFAVYLQGNKTKRANFYLDDFYQQMYYFNELNNGGGPFNCNVFDIPYPIFHGYLKNQIKMKKKQNEEQKRKLKEIPANRNRR